MINKNIESAKLKAEALKREYEELCAVLVGKKAEIEGLASGYGKYEDNAAMRLQMELLIKQRINELKEINDRIDGLGKKYKQAKEELNCLFVASKPEIAGKKERIAQTIVKISKTTSDDKMLEVAIEKKETNKASVAAQNEAKIAPQKLQPASDKRETLYDKAAQEAKAQEEFLKKISGSSRGYGSA